MRPVGLPGPATGHVPYAVVQLRRENLRSDSFNMVGFQNQLKWSEQKRVFRMIPGLEAVEFVRFGQMHRNTYLRAPRLLTPALNLRTRPDVFVAGQLCGVEGYVESIATGLSRVQRVAPQHRSAAPCVAAPFGPGLDLPLPRTRGRG